MTRFTARGDLADLREHVGAVAERWLGESADRVRVWRRRGADLETVLFYLAMERVDRMIDRSRGRRRHVMVASFFKSASTYTRKLLAEVTGYRPYYLNLSGKDNEKNIQRRAIPLFLAQDTVTVEPMRATRSNVELLSAMGIRPIVLVRDVFDTAVSLHEHRTRETTGGSVFAHNPADFRAWDRRDRYWFIIRMVMPWYLTFFASWQDAASELDVLWITYDQITTDTTATVERVLAHSGVECDREQVHRTGETIDLSDVLFNRGVSGRGRNELTEDQRAALKDIAATFNGRYDFSMIGL